MGLLPCEQLPLVEDVQLHHSQQIHSNSIPQITGFSPEQLRNSRGCEFCYVSPEDILFRSGRSESYTPQLSFTVSTE